jgi:hypothetical protein
MQSGADAGSSVQWQVSTALFYRSVEETLNRKIDLLEVCWRRKNGDVYIPSAKTIAECIAEGVAEDDVQAFYSFLRRPAGQPPGWLQMYERMRTDPLKFHQRAERDPDFVWDFDECCNWARAFRVLSPIKDKRFALSQARALERSGFTVDMAALDSGGDFLFACTCGVYLHYALCKHTVAKAKEDHLLLAYPPMRDPTRTDRQKEPSGQAGAGGRPKRSKGGWGGGRPSGES